MVYMLLPKFLGLMSKTETKETIEQTHYGNGDNVTGNKYSTEYKPYTSEQYINHWPTSLGGNDSINLDNAGDLTVIDTNGVTGITLALNTVNIETFIPHVIKYNDPVKINLDTGEVIGGNTTFSMTSLKILVPDSRKYEFDSLSNKTHIVETNGRKFNITLKEVARPPVPHVADPLKYVFKISEIQSAI